jgi:hypothetical protein
MGMGLALALAVVVWTEADSTLIQCLEVGEIGGADAIGHIVHEAPIRHGGQHFGGGDRLR